MDHNIDFEDLKPPQVEQIEKMFRDGEMSYFDVDDFEEILDYYMTAGSFKKAKTVAEFAIIVHPSSITLKILTAKVLALNNEEKNALSILREVEGIDSEDQDLFLTKGAIYSQLKHYEKAIEEYNKALPESESPDYIYCNIAFEYENMGDYKKTIEYLHKALELNPNNNIAMHEAAYCFDLLSLTDESIQFFQQHIDRHPYSEEAWFNLGSSYINASLYEKAIEAFDYCLAIDEGYSMAYLHKAVAYSFLHDYASAIECYRKSFDEEEDSPMTLYYIGECYEKMEQYENAIHYYRKTLKYDQEIIDAWIGIGVCELECGNIKIAIQSMQKGLALDPENTTYLCLIADAYLNASDKKNCAKYFEKAILFDNIDEDTWIDYIEAMIAFNDIDAALDVSKRSIDAIPDSNILYYQAAICLYLKGNNKEADFFLEEALQNDPEFQNKKILKNYPELNSNKSFLSLIELYEK